MMNNNKENEKQNGSSATQQEQHNEDSIIDFYLALLASKKGFPQKYNEPKPIFSKIGVPIFLGNNFVAPTLKELLLWIEDKGVRIGMSHLPYQGYRGDIVKNINKSPKYESLAIYHKHERVAIYKSLEYALNSLPSEPLVISKIDIASLIVACDTKEELKKMFCWYFKQFNTHVYVSPPINANDSTFNKGDKVFVKINNGFRCYEKGKLAYNDQTNLIDFETFHLFVKDRPFTIAPQPQPINPKEPTRRHMSIDLFKMFLDLMLTTTKKQPSKPEPPKDMNLHELMMSTPGWDMSFGKMPIDFSLMPFMALNTGRRIPHPLDRMAAISMSIMKDGKLKDINIASKHKPNKPKEEFTIDFDADAALIKEIKEAALHTFVMYGKGKGNGFIDMITDKPKEELIIGFDAASKESDKTAFSLIFGDANAKDPLKKEVGGEHYLNMSMQPAELCGLLDLNGFQFSALQYLSRNKGDEIEQLQKAKHIVQLAQKFDKSVKTAIDGFLSGETTSIICDYKKANNLSDIHCFTIYLIVAKDYKMAEIQINHLINNLSDKTIVRNGNTEK